MDSLVDQFLNIYKNEKNTRKLLRYSHDVINELRMQISYQEEYIEKIKGQKQLKAIYEQEIEYLKFFLCDYLKIRLQKIHKNFYLPEDNMSENESKFHKSLIEKYKELDIYVDQTEEYNDVECVGFIALDDIGHVVIEGQTVDISFGDFFVVQLKDIQHLLDEKRILLV